MYIFIKGVGILNIEFVFGNIYLASFAEVFHGSFSHIAGYHVDFFKYFHGKSSQTLKFCERMTLQTHLSSEKLEVLETLLSKLQKEFELYEP